MVEGEPEVVVEMLGAAIPSQHWAMAFGPKIVAGPSIREGKNKKTLSQGLAGRKESDFLTFQLQQREGRSNNVGRERERETLEGRE